MRLIGLLSFFDEPAENLALCVAGLAKASVEHLVAVDGRYGMFPGDEHLSHPNQHAALVLACREAGIALTLHTPAGAWSGNEVQKRSFLFAAGHLVAQPGDWLWVMDADEFIVQVPDDLRDQLARTTLDVGEVALHDEVMAAAGRPDFPATTIVRKLFRSGVEPITVGPAHWDYLTADGRLLWGSEGAGRGRDGRMELAFEVPGLLVEHRPERRPRERVDAKMSYYRDRDDAGVEAGACWWCTKRAARQVACDWQWNPQLGAPVSQWRPACMEHAERADRKSRGRLRYLGVDPDTVRILNHNGRLPAAEGAHAC